MTGATNNQPRGVCMLDVKIQTTAKPTRACCRDQAANLSEAFGAAEQ